MRKKREIGGNRFFPEKPRLRSIRGRKKPRFPRWEETSGFHRARVLASALACAGVLASALACSRRWSSSSRTIARVRPVLLRCAPSTGGRALAGCLLCRGNSLSPPPSLGPVRSPTPASSAALAPVRAASALARSPTPCGLRAHDVERAAALALGPRAPEPPGTLFITTRRVIWLSDAEKGKGYAVDFVAVSLHAVSRDPEAYPSPCIYTQISLLGALLIKKMDFRREKEKSMNIY